MLQLTSLTSIWTAGKKLYLIGKSHTCTKWTHRVQTSRPWQVIQPRKPSCYMAYMPIFFLKHTACSNLAMYLNLMKHNPTLYSKTEIKIGHPQQHYKILSTQECRKCHHLCYGFNRFKDQKFEKLQLSKKETVK